MVLPVDNLPFQLDIVVVHSLYPQSLLDVHQGRSVLLLDELADCQIIVCFVVFAVQLDCLLVVHYCFLGYVQGEVGISQILVEVVFSSGP